MGLGVGRATHHLQVKTIYFNERQITRIRPISIYGLYLFNNNI